MTRKPEPSLELKKMIWDVASQVGKDKYAEIERQLDYELEKLRKDGHFFEGTPDVRTIRRIVQDINKLTPEVVVAKLPQYVWALRDDSQTLSQMAKANDQALPTEEQPAHVAGQAELARNHDEVVFRRSNALLSEERLRDFLWPLDGGPPIYYHDKLDAVYEFLRFFSYAGNQYVDCEAKRLCDNLCKALRILGTFLSRQFDSPDRIGPVRGWEMLIPTDIKGAYYAGDADPEESKMYRKYFNGLQKLKANCTECFTQYRVYLRDTLLV